MIRGDDLAHFRGDISPLSAIVLKYKVFYRIPEFVLVASSLGCIPLHSNGLR
jgi:hypothetical protein